MDQGAIEGALDSASDGSVNKSRNDVRYKRWIREQSWERWKVQARDEGGIEGALDGKALDL